VVGQIVEECSSGIIPHRSWDRQLSTVAREWSGLTPSMTSSSGVSQISLYLRHTNFWARKMKNYSHYIQFFLHLKLLCYWPFSV